MAGGAVDQPYRLAIIVMQLRSFADAYHTWKSAKSQANVHRTPMMERVIKIELEVIRDLQAKGKLGVKVTA